MRHLSRWSGALLHSGISGRIWAGFEGRNGAPGEAQRSGFAGERRRSGASEFSPFWAETGDAELATTSSRRERRGRGPSGAATSARSAGSFPLRGRGFPEPLKWSPWGRPGGKARGSRENRGVPGREKGTDQQSGVEGQTAAHGCQDPPVTGATAAQMLLCRVKEKASPVHQKSFSKKIPQGLAISRRFGYCVLLTRRRYTCTTT